MAEDTLDEIKGRTKEAAGDLTGDKGLQREGEVDQASASVKDKMGDAFGKAKDIVDDVADKAKDRFGHSSDND
ncbi:MAG: hypothetical protein QOG09_1893 [Solirubrobacterales bacterium]|jgi:uncharacterized protein YjbJ (UPF0337 family)|nr:hypothetical protein [Solirubrobacterales bacterium]MDX6652587.1 hypothetical protein [Solirubrobacterales bacterium]MDX6663791.1 hypothetical protein [Solirubrobacterales bacterium]